MRPSTISTSLLFASTLALSGTVAAQTSPALDASASPDAAPEPALPAPAAPQDAAARAEADPTPAPAPEAPAPSSERPFTLGGYAEAYYQLSFGAPSNGITAYRGFDSRAGTFTLSNVALDALWDQDDLIGRLTLQVGHTPSTYYLGEPTAPAGGAVNASGPELWKLVQQAYVGDRLGIGRGLTVTAGIFLSPIGPESIAVRDNWSWSRSNLFFGLPFYHTGARASYALSDAWAVTLAGYNGWNSVVDNNDEKSVSAQLTRTGDDVTLSALYFGGVERPPGAPEGRAWRNTFDAHVGWQATPRLALLVHADAGFEPNEFGVSAWGAGAVSARVQILDPLFFAARGDVFYERVAQSDAGSAALIFWPVPWVASGTATLDYRPQERASLRLEYRHDQAGGDLYFGGEVEGDGIETPFVPNRAAQDTLTAGLTTWF